MEHNVKMVFQKAYLFTGSLGYTEQDQHKKILAAQVMTDVIMQNFSPVVMDGKAYAKFSDGYMLNDRKAFEEVTELNSNEEYFLTAKKNYEAAKTDYAFSQAKNRELKVQLNQLVSAENIDRIAVEQLGLVKVTSGNEIYLDTSDGNKVIFSQNK
jgi:multidrug efflux pump subunit AcrA (membrane-fusion protein)